MGKACPVFLGLFLVEVVVIFIGLPWPLSRKAMRVNPTIIQHTSNSGTGHFTSVVYNRTPPFSGLQLTENYKISPESSPTDTELGETRTQASYLKYDETGTNGAETFQRVEDLHLWTYSAFYSPLSVANEECVWQNSVYILALVEVPFTETLQCMLQLSGGKGLHMVDAIFNATSDQHNITVQVVTVWCPVSEDFQPTHVSLTTDADTKKALSNELKILYPGSKQRNLTVCHAVLHSHFDSTSQFIYEMELNQILGADHVEVYNYSVSPEADHIMRHYQSQGALTVHQWPLPAGLQVRYFGQVLAINDCINRNRGVSKYVVVLDTDEFIIPKANVTLVEMVQRIEDGFENQRLGLVRAYIKRLRLPQNTSVPWEKFTVSIQVEGLDSRYPVNTIPGSFTARTAHFSKPSKNNAVVLPPFTKNEQSSINQFHITPLTDLYRDRTILAQSIRPKTILRPDRVCISGVHLVYHHIPGAKRVVMSPELVVTHHYRQNKTGEFVVYEPTVMRLHDVLIRRVQQTFELIRPSHP